MFVVPIAYGHGGGGCSGGNGGFGCFGGLGSYRPYESPRMDHDYKFGGFVLQVPRRDWSVSIYKENSASLLAEFQSSTILIRVTGFSKKITSFGAAVAGCAPKQFIALSSYDIRSSCALKGRKIIYGTADHRYTPRQICYLFPVRDGAYVCFSVTPIARYPDWIEANHLVTGNLRYAK